MATETFADRLRRVIAERKITQSRLADMLLVTPSAVSGWLRGAMPYDRTVALIAAKLGVSKNWLLTGAGALEARYEPFTDVLRRISERATLFEQVEGEYEHLISDAKQRVEMLIERLREFRIRFRREGEKSARTKLELATLPGLHLTTSTSVVEDSLMRNVPSLDDLLTEVRRLTNRPGARKALSDRLKITQSQLSKWLSLRSDGATYSPSAANALKLLAWVIESRDAQQEKSPEGAQTPPGQMAQLRNPNDETTKSDQRKSSARKRDKTTQKRVG